MPITSRRLPHVTNRLIATLCVLGTFALPPAAVAQQVSPQVIERLQVRIGELERLVSELTGKVEEARYENSQLKAELAKIHGDVDYRLNALEGNPTPPAATPNTSATVQSPGPSPFTAPSSTFTPPPAANVSPTMPTTTSAPTSAVTLPAGSENDQYNYAFSLLQNAEYGKAEEAFKAFIARNPKGKLTGNAQYWLGETYYVRGDFEQAAVAFMNGYQNYPQSSKAPDNLLKLGLSLGSLGKKPEACAAFNRISSQYPKAIDAIKRRAQSETSRLGC